MHGCLLCRKKGKPCSFAEHSLERADVAQSSLELDGLQQRVDQLERYSRELETRLSMLEKPLSASAVLPAVQAQDGKPQVGYFALLQNLGEERASAWEFQERLFSATSLAGYTDVVARGLVTADQVDMAFQL